MTKKAEIYYFRFPNCRSRRNKLILIKILHFKDLPFQRIIPDKDANWINQTNNDFESLIPVCDKQVKLGKSQQAIFSLFSNGISTNRDEWVYDFSRDNLEKKMSFFFEEYNNELLRWQQWKIENTYKEIAEESDPVLDKFLAERNLIKWSSRLKRDKLRKDKIGYFDRKEIKLCYYRPFVKNYIYYGYNPIDVKGEFHNILLNESDENRIISCRCIDADNLVTLLNNGLSDLNYLKMGNGGTFCLPLYLYDKSGTRHENITDWALKAFQTQYVEISELSKTDIFHYVYAVLHNPAYREKYAQNLKREFPRLPFYADFPQWVQWGKQLMDLHLNYENIAAYPLQRQEIASLANPKAKLKADKTAGSIQLDDNTLLSNIPAAAWEYQLGNRSALEWILDQYKEKKPKDPTIAEKFNNYRFAEYKEQVIDLLQRVCTVSVETIQIIEAMKTEY